MMIEDLRARIVEAEAAGDLETAGLLREALGRLESGDSKLREQRPGAMGLGTSQESYSTEGSPLPKKPDPMTKGHKPGGRRRS
ncbi:MAG: excinuclease ABC subunit B [Phenylobacterium sp.]|nr:MAG: excinuclease ABC subunit B [Phenylobacterium sp.]